MPTGTIPVESLKSPTDPNLPFYSFKQVISTSEIKMDIFNQFGAYAKAVIITNLDKNNNISVILNEPNAPSEIIPPSTKGESDVWANFIDLTPDAVTGNGVLELWLVRPEDARKQMSPQQMAQDTMSRMMM